MNLHESLVGEIREMMQSDSYDIQRLYKKLARHDLNKIEIQYLIYSCALSLNRKLFLPVTKIEIMHTNACNLGCRYCFENKMRKKGVITKEIVKKSIDLLFDYSLNEKDIQILHFGGEPLLNFPSVRYATEYAEEKAANQGKNVKFKMTTNGTLLDRNMAEYLTLHKIKVLFSLDGAQESNDRFRVYKNGDGTFDDVMKSINIMRELNNWTGVKVTVCQENVRDLFDDIMYLYRNGVNQFIIGYSSGAHWTSENINIYKDEMQKLKSWYEANCGNDIKISEFEKSPAKTSYFGCQAGKNSISISTGGEISPCSKLLAQDSENLVCNLGDVWHGLYNINNRFNLIDCSELKEACRQKGIYDNYRGGCFASNYEEHKSIFYPNLLDYQFSANKIDCE